MWVILGILLATLLFLVLRPADRRAPWHQPVAWLLAALLAIGTIVAGVALRTGGLERSEQVAEREKLRHPDQLTYWAIAIGMPRNEVRYLKGEPAEQGEADAAGRAATWTWYPTPSRSHAYVVAFDAADRVVAVACAGGGPFDCERVGGVPVGAPEGEVVRLLGEPTSVRPPDAAGRKGLRYAGRTTTLEFVLERGAVVAIGLHRGDVPLPVPAVARR